MKAFIWLTLGGILLAVAGVVTAFNAKQEWALILGIVLAVAGVLVAFGSILARAFLVGYTRT